MAGILSAPILYTGNIESDWYESIECNKPSMMFLVPPDNMFGRNSCSRKYAQAKQRGLQLMSRASLKSTFWGNKPPLPPLTL
jgi:hypothetical protein